MESDEEETAMELPPGVTFTPASTAPLPEKKRRSSGSNIQNFEKPKQKPTILKPQNPQSQRQEQQRSQQAAGSGVFAAKNLKTTNDANKNNNIHSRPPPQQKKNPALVARGAPPHKRPAAPATTSSTVPFTYHVSPGNNSLVILQVLRLRPWFGSLPKSCSKYDPCVNLAWSMWRDDIRGRKTKRSAMTSCNHLDGNGKLVRKGGLFKTLVNYYAHRDRDGEDIHDVIPPTFLLRKGEGEKGGERERFLKYFEARVVDENSAFGLVNPGRIEAFKEKEELEEEEEGEEGEEGEEREEEEEELDPELKVSERDSSEEMVGAADSDSSSVDKTPSIPLVPSSSSPSPQPLPQSQSDSAPPGSLWILKPSASTNRGCGIKLCSSLPEIISTVDVLSTGSPLNDRLTARHGWVVQKYLERPLLVRGRKFDIRVFVLFVVEGEEVGCYVYEEYYVRLSGVKYSTSVGKIKDKRVHLTNDAIQSKAGIKNGKSNNDKSGSTSGNADLDSHKMSRGDFEEYCASGLPGVTGPVSVLSDMKKLVKISALAAGSGSLNPSSRKLGFELLGYDFMLDSSLKPYLIEINSNPSLEHCCPLLERVVREVVEATFGTAVDPFFGVGEENLTKRGREAKANLDEIKEGNKFTRICVV